MMARALARALAPWLVALLAALLGCSGQHGPGSIDVSGTLVQGGDVFAFSAN